MYLEVFAPEPEEGNMTVKQICEITNVSRSALYRRLQDKV
ncbi:helix-turn-helix domain-containing protein [Bacillus cereus group sp. N21]|nr:helix-turn-helix domain-containing protein [Bacillus cereus group sp. N21]